MNPLLKNAVVSIQLGLEDFASDDERRIISAARNLYSGVLLLAKEVLRQLSPLGSNDILIRTKKKAVKEADGPVRLVGDGKKTIDRFEIEETFKQLQLAVDLSNLKRLADIRNDIEHMHPQHAPALIQEAIADAMPIIRDIIVRELHEEPSALLGQPAWDALLDQAKVFKAEQDACRESFEAIDWESETLADALKEFRCPNCSASLLRNDNADAKVPADLHLICSKCGKKPTTKRSSKRRSANIWRGMLTLPQRMATIRLWRTARSVIATRMFYLKAGASIPAATLASMDTNARSVAKA